MRVNKQFIAVRIDRAAQQKKRETLESGIWLAPSHIYMKHNLQYGEVTDIGTTAAKIFPYVEVGDTLLFKHYIENQDERVIGRVDNPEYPGQYNHQDTIRIIDGTSETQTLGVIKKDGTLIPSPTFVFVAPVVKPYASRILRDHPLLFNGNEDIWMDDSQIEYKIEKLKLDRDSMLETAESERKNPYRFEELYKAAATIAAEQEIFSKLLHSKRFCVCTVTFVHPDTAKEMADIEPGSQIVTDVRILYRLTTLDKDFYLIYKDEAEFVINN